MREIIEFIEQNRQAGTTTALVNLLIAHDGYLVVANNSIKERLTKQYPSIKRNIVTLHEIKSGKTNGLGNKPIYFDTDVVYDIVCDYLTLKGLNSLNNGLRTLNQYSAMLDGYGVQDSNPYNKNTWVEDCLPIDKIQQFLKISSL